MVYTVVRMSPSYYQLSLEDFWFSDVSKKAMNPNTACTKTYVRREPLDKQLESVDISALIRSLECFNRRHSELFEKDRKELYREFYIPKKSGGLRRIDAPNCELMYALSSLKGLFEASYDDGGFNALYHTSAFAYVKNRSTLDAVKRHQINESKWFEKLDFHDFFGSTTKEFVMSMLSQIFPFSEVYRDNKGRAELDKAIDLAFLNGGLPQGTPISPLITNIIMIPIDYTISKKLRELKSSFVYTRYADDMIISSKYDFDWKEIQKMVVDVAKSFNAPFELNQKKTRYGSSAGQNFNLGIMLNKDNNLTVGHEKKRVFKAMLTSYIMDNKNGKKWEKNDVQVMEGLRNYYSNIEKENIDSIIAKLNDKFGVNVISMIKEDLRP